MSDNNLLKRLWADLGHAKNLVLLALLLYVPITVLSVTPPLVIGYAVQHAMLTKNSFMLLKLSAAFFIMVAAVSLADLWQGFLLQKTGQILAKNLREQAFRKIQKLSMGFLDETPLGRILTRVTNDTEAVVEMFSTGAVQIVGDSLFLIATFIMLFFVDIHLSLYALLVLPFLVLIMYLFRLWTKRAYVLVRNSLSELNSFLQEYLHGITTVQITGQLSGMHEEFDRANLSYQIANRKAVVLDALIYSVVDFMSYFASALILWGAFGLKMDNALSMGVLIAFFESLSRFFQPGRELSNRTTIFQSALVSLERIYQLLLWPEEEDRIVNDRPPFKDKIEFKHVYFAYNNGEEALKDVSFTVHKNQRVALVGATGAGKSTVIKLLNRFYKVKRGAILIDNKNIDELSLGDSRTLISVVPQEVFLFKGTLRENLVFGNKEASDEDIWHALSLVQMKTNILERGGLLLEVLERGQNFSAGEKQLLAFARALIRNPPILILDEATASVDTITEKRLQKATDELLKARTSLVIAHRLSTILSADKILVFAHGELVEEGTHEELMACNGVYASMVRHGDHKG